MNKIIQEMIKYGYVFTKDISGYYFDKGNFKITITKTGPVYNVFKNELVNRTYILRAKQLNFINTDLLLKWLLTKLN